jgi:Na+/proline symporter
MPVGVKGFLIVAIFAAAMSSVASAMSALSSVSVMDFIKPFMKEKRSEHWYLQCSKFTTIFWAILLIIVAKVSESQPPIFNWAFSLTGLTSGAMLGGLILALYAKHLNPIAVVWGMCIAVTVMIAMQLSGIKWFAWPWLTLIGTLISIGVTLLIDKVYPANTNHKYSNKESL